MLRVVAGAGGGLGRTAIIAVATGLAFSGCSPAPDDATAQQQGAVRYRSGPAIGTWPADTAADSANVGNDDPTDVGGAGSDTAPTMSNGTAGSGTAVGGAAGAMAGGTGGMGMAGNTMSTGGHTGSGGMGSGGIGSGGMGSGGMTGGATGAFAFDVTTVDQGGRYAPRNVGAIWIETSSGAFVKTLKVWARTRGRYLTRFNSEAGGSRVDAVTAATLRPFQAHHVTWDLTDVNGTAVANGSYRVVFEVTDHDGTGKSGEATFELTGDPATVMPPDQQYFTGMQITLQ